MAEPTQSAKGQVLNDRTYQEVEYLKKNLGPILVAALAEICIRRPADPIEYLGHWLLRWRYNEELKRRDVQNALEVVRQKAWTKEEEVPAADQIQNFGQGFTPDNPNAPPGYGGPLEASALAEVGKSDAPAGGPEDGGERRASGEKRPSGEKRASEGGERRASGEQEKRGSGQEERRASGEQRRASGEAAPGGEPGAEEAPGETLEEKRASTGAAADEPPPEPEEPAAEEPQAE